RLLIFKERVCEKTVFLSSAALSAAEKGDYEHCFAVRQQLFYWLVATAGFIFLPPSAPRCRQRERGVILGTSRVPRKGFEAVFYIVPDSGTLDAAARDRLLCAERTRI
ncbi:hypothetical protein, partial [Burkholderia ubonensis]|uniref:hypothetical protein n=1 Tax=Burkholderia ubonensis TaxID=101571 RepID=UPI001E303AAE